MRRIGLLTSGGDAPTTLETSRSPGFYRPDLV